MAVRIVLHIFRKDARRLWPHILVTWFLVISLACQDGWRSDWMTGFVEGWLNLLVPLAWVCLVALAVEQEPLAGDRQFWITRPYRRPTLLAAKLLFVLVFIHAPSLLADAYILSARGFSPIAAIAQLLWKQVLLAGAVTLPALALASLVGSFAQFMLALFAVAGGLAFLAGGLPTPGSPAAIDQIRHGVIILLLSAAAAGIAWMHFIRRRTPASRVAGATAAVAAGAIALLMPPAYSYAIKSALAPVHAQPSIHLASRLQPPPFGWASPMANRVTLALPIDVSGVPDSDRFRLQHLHLGIVGATGERYQTVVRSRYQPYAKVLVDAYLVSYDDPAPNWIFVRLDRSVLDRLKGGRVKVEGEAAITTYRLGETTWMPAGGEGRATGVGRCASSLGESMSSDGLLKVECESPSQLPIARVRLWSPETGAEWKARFGDGPYYSSIYSSNVPGQYGAWLSPLSRRQASFQIADNPKGYGSQWLVPRAALGTLKIAVTPELVTGYAVLHYEMTDLDLNNFVVQSPGR